MRDDSGFTLIELMITIAIFVILTAIVTPNWLIYRSKREVGNAAMDVVNTLQSAKLRAVRMNNAATVALPAISGSAAYSADSLTGIIFDSRGFPNASGQVTVSNGAKTLIITLSSGGSIRIN